jgi:P27 family predicted phage terminase small subunit
MTKRKSTATHQLAGSFRADRHGASGLQFPAATGTAPRWLSKVAKTEWKRIAPFLLELGQLQETDLAILGSYCEAFAGYLSAKALVEEQGHIITVESQTRTGRTSKPIRNPAVTLMLDFQRSMLAAASKLGFSPFDRSKLDGTSPDDEEETLQPTYTVPTATAKATKPTKVATKHGDALGAFIQFPGTIVEAETEDE